MTEQELTEFFSYRLSQLRLQQGISARDMSLSLGRSESMINQIENKKTFPSMKVFFQICIFLNIHPKDFFNEAITEPAISNELYQQLSKLTPAQTKHLLEFLKDFNH